MVVVLGGAGRARGGGGRRRSFSGGGEQSLLVNSTSQRRFCWFNVEALGLMRIIRGMQRSFCCEDLNNNKIKNNKKKSSSQGIIGITAPKARTRDKRLRGRV